MLLLPILVLRYVLVLRDVLVLRYVLVLVHRWTSYPIVGSCSRGPMVHQMMAAAA
jgi:hypothetical protein